MAKNTFHYLAISVVLGLLAYTNQHGFLLFIAYLAYMFFQVIRKRSSIMVLLCAVACFLYIYATLAKIAVGEEIVEETNIRIHGQIMSQLQQTDKQLSFIFQETDTKEKYVITYFLPQATPYTYEFYNRSYCQIEGRLQTPKPASNPFEFDYRQYLLNRGIEKQLILNSLDQIQCSNHHHILTKMDQIRIHLLNQLKKQLDSDLVAWQQALLFGNKQYLDESVTTLFQRWGLSHVLAISGLHVGIVISILYLLLLRVFRLTVEGAELLVIAFLPIYALLAGSQPSVWRASLMIIVLLLLNRWNLSLSRLDLLSIVFLLFVLFDPTILFHIGFQFSFAVTLGLILSVKWFSQAKSSVHLLFQISFISQMVILPLQMHYFYFFQPFSIVVNVFAVPYFSFFVIPYMFMALLFPYIPSIMADPLQALFNWVQDRFILVLKSLDQTINTPFVFGEVNLLFSLIYYSLLFLMMIQLERERLKRAFTFGIAISLLLTLYMIKPYLSNNGSVTIFDIGQGDAILIELPYRKAVFFIDLGASVDFKDNFPKKTVYKNIIQAYLMGRGITKIDSVFISHPHLDHHGSLRFLLEDYQVDEIIIDPYAPISDPEIQAWRSKGKKIKRAQFHERIRRKGQDFYVLSPSDDRLDTNDNSLVLFTRLGQHTWLFTGDISEKVEKELIERYGNLQVDVLKVAHHGSKSSSSKEFLEHVKPKVAIIPVGRKNRYGHPSEEALERLLDQDITIFRTDLDGAIQYRFNSRQSKIERFLDRDS